jgi:hypothetical protein
MGTYSGLQMINKWTTQPVAWLKSHINAAVTSVTRWKTELSNKQQFMAKHKLIKKLR